MPRYAGPNPLHSKGGSAFRPSVSQHHAEGMKWVGQTMLYRADFAGARDRLVMAVNQYDGQDDNRDWAAYTNTDPRVANRCHLAMSLARDQLSRGWELRATMSLFRLWQRQGRQDEARAVLAAIYNAYTEGFTTPDLVDAAAMLETRS